MLYIGNNIKHLREQKNLNQSDVAKFFDIKGNTFSNWELEKTYPRVPHLIKLTEYFKVTIEDLLFSDLSKKGKGEGKGIVSTEPNEFMRVDESTTDYEKTTNYGQNLQKLIEANAELAETVHQMSKNQQKLMDYIESLEKGGCPEEKV